MLTSSVSPVIVATVVPVTQHFGRLLHLIQPKWVVYCERWTAIAIDDLIGSGNEPVFIPLRTGTSLPLETAAIAKLGPTDTSTSYQSIESS